MSCRARTTSARVVRTTASLLAASLLAACSGPSDTEEPAPSPEVVERGALVVCTELPYAPFVQQEEGGEPSGFELDLLRLMAAGLDLDLEVRQTPYAVLDDGRALRRDRCDVAAGALLVTEDRAESMQFVDPHYDVTVSLLVPTASDIEGLADLSGRRLAVQEGTTAERYARRHVPADTDVEVFDGDQYMVTALRDGRVDAVLQELPLSLAHTESGRFTIVERLPTGERYAFAVRPEADRLRLQLDRELAELRRDGGYEELYTEYFGVP